MHLFILLVSIPCLCAELIENRPIGSGEELQKLATRLLGDNASRFSLLIDPNVSINGKEVVKISKQNSSPGIVAIVGSSATAVAYGLNNYLKYYLNCHVSWDGDQLSLPIDWPDVNYQLTFQESLRYYMNVCTFSYSYVWWNWTRWEREIDWMALNGFNLVLAFTGMEAVWSQVYKELGFTQEEIDEHASGPAFLAWHRMGNIRGGGHLSPNWHENQVQLQRKILDRMRALGITPVLPAFAGHLPRAITRVYPNVSITYASRWNNFPDELCCPALLQPTDPLFDRIGKMFINKITETFGTNHIYSCDPFNEMNPSTEDLNDLQAFGRSIYASMAAADPSAVWLLQGWFLANDRSYWNVERANAFLSSVPTEKMIILDLQGETFPIFKLFNIGAMHPFIFCMLHNFGRTLGMHASISQFYQNLRSARESNTPAVGIGLTMEGIGTDYAIYDLFTDLAVSPNIISTELVKSNSYFEWFRSYVKRRYGMIGQTAEHASAAWYHLMISVYDYQGTTSIHGQFVFNNRPSLKKNIWHWYQPGDVYMAWESLLLAGTTGNSTSDLFKVDLIDTTRQGLQLKFDELYLTLKAGFQGNNIALVKQISSSMLGLLDDLDQILNAHEQFLLGVWLEDAKAMGHNRLEKRLYERDARYQITLWGPNGEILDYANKQWAGVVINYFKPRWSIFFNNLIHALERGTSFDNAKYQREVFEVEKKFAESDDIYPTIRSGDALTKSAELFKKWVHQ